IASIALQPSNEAAQTNYLPPNDAPAMLDVIQSDSHHHQLPVCPIARQSVPQRNSYPYEIRSNGLKLRYSRHETTPGTQQHR
ncbi:hypothetical protein ARMSODRAFT_954873, partial [Armillaria solidipes]